MANVLSTSHIRSVLKNTAQKILGISVQLQVCMQPCMVAVNMAWPAFAAANHAAVGQTDGRWTDRQTDGWDWHRTITPCFIFFDFGAILTYRDPARFYASSANKATLQQCWPDDDVLKLFGTAPLAYAVETVGVRAVWQNAKALRRCRLFLPDNIHADAADFVLTALDCKR